MATWPRTNRKNNGISRHFKKEADQGGERGYIYTKIVSRRYPTPGTSRFKAFYFPGVFGTSAVWPSGPDGEPGPGRWVGNGASENAR